MEETEAAETPAEVKSTARRGRGKVETNLEATITKQPPKSRLVAEAAAPAEVTPRKGRGRPKKEEEEVAEAAISPPKRGRKKKPAEAEEVSAEETKPVKRGRKAVKAVEVGPSYSNL